MDNPQETKKKIVCLPWEVLVFIGSSETIRYAPLEDEDIVQI